MNEHQIHCFFLVAEEMNFSKAARRFGISQPAVSKTIATLESELGVLLFSREKSKTVRLTEAGERYLAFFRETAERWARLHSEFENETKNAPLRFILPDYLDGLFPPPQMAGQTVTMQALPLSELAAALNQGHADFALCLQDEFLPIRQYRFTTIGRSEAVFFFSPAHFQRFERELSPTDFADSVCYFVAGESHRRMNLWLEQACLPHGFRPRIVYLSDWVQVLEKVRAGQGVTLCYDFCAAEVESLSAVGLGSWQVFLLVSKRRISTKICDEMLHALQQQFP